MEDDYFKGRGAQIKSENKFLKAQYVTDHIEGLDEPLLENPKTQIFRNFLASAAGVPARAFNLSA